MAYAHDSYTEYELNDNDKLFEYITKGNLSEIKNLVKEKKVDITSDKCFDNDTARLPVPFAAYYVTTRLSSDEHLSDERKRNIYKIISYLVTNGATINDPLLDKEGIYISELIKHFPELQNAVNVGKKEKKEQQQLLTGPTIRKRRKRSLRHTKKSLGGKKRRKRIRKTSRRRRNISHKKKH